MIDRRDYRLVIPGPVNALFHPGYFDPLVRGSAAKSLMNIAELETAAVSGKFRELRAQREDGRGREGGKDGRLGVAINYLNAVQRQG